MLRKGRGRLSSIDLLPEDAQPEISWARVELEKRERLQKDIHAEFNARLADKGIGPISASAFGRHSIKVAEMDRRRREFNDHSEHFSKNYDPKKKDDYTTMIADTIKMLIYEIIQGASDAGFNPKQAKEMAEALRALVSAEKVSTEVKEKVEKQLAERVEAVTETIGREAGLSEDRIAQLRRDFLGVKEAA